MLSEAEKNKAYTRLVRCYQGEDSEIRKLSDMRMFLSINETPPSERDAIAMAAGWIRMRAIATHRPGTGTAGVTSISHNIKRMGDVAETLSEISVIVLGINALKQRNSAV